MDWLFALSSVAAFRLTMLSAASYVNPNPPWSQTVGGPLVIEHGLTGYWRLRWESNASHYRFLRIEMSDGMIYLEGPGSWPDTRIHLNHWAACSAIASFVLFIDFMRRRIRLFMCGECLKCGNDLTGNVSGVCSECGKQISAFLTALDHSNDSNNGTSCFNLPPVKFSASGLKIARYFGVRRHRKMCGLPRPHQPHNRILRILLDGRRQHQPRPRRRRHAEFLLEARELLRQFVGN